MLRLFNWFFRRVGYELVPVDSTVMRLTPEALLVSAMARPLVEKLDKLEGVSPEYRRHDVYAALLKRFPQVPAMDVSIAVEHALRKWRASKEAS